MTCAMTQNKQSVGAESHGVCCDVLVLAAKCQLEQVNNTYLYIWILPPIMLYVHHVAS